MRAATVTKFGGPEVFEVVETPDPEPRAGQVVINVEVADVLMLDTVVRSGAGQDYWPMRPPYVPGGGVAGRVGRVGADVEPGLLGRRVVARTGAAGGYADRVVVDAGTMAEVPEGLDLTVAAALLHDGVTALALFEVTQIGARDALLVIGASGGLGVLAVQLGRARAARVVATARGPKLARVGRLGPHTMIDSDDPDWVKQARAALGQHGADVVLDNVGGELGEASFSLLAADGRFSAHGMPSGRFAQVDPSAADHRVTVTDIRAAQLSDADVVRYLKQAMVEAAAGTMSPVIGQTFPLEQVAAAHAAIEARDVFGKTLITTTS